MSLAECERGLFQWDVECGMWVLDKKVISWPEHQMLILTTIGQDVKRPTANHGYSVTEEINLPHAQECLEIRIKEKLAIIAFQSHQRH